MITGLPDRSIGLERLEREIQGFRKDISVSPVWKFRETYIDRCLLDPFYIIQYRPQNMEAGDDLYNQELFTTPFSHLKGVCMTREAKEPGGAYWREISKFELNERLNHFLKMYKENYLQPPGYRGDVCFPKETHERIKEKRFLFEIRSDKKGIIGVGPKMYAGVLDTGAICGQVTDENGLPLDEINIELYSKNIRLLRTTKNGGLFWFSKVPKGKYEIKVMRRSCLVHILRQEEFGNMKGWLTDQDGKPVENAELNFSSPDGEIFKGFSNASGKFTTGPLPAYPVQNSPLSRFPYILRIPSFLFSVQKSITVSDAVIGGVLKDENGAALAAQKIALKQSDKSITETFSDALGNFIFFGLKGGRYQIEVEGQKIFVQQINGGSVTGNTGQIKSTILELIVQNSIVFTERTSISGEFTFDNVAPGHYTLNRKETPTG